MRGDHAGVSDTPFMDSIQPPGEASSVPEHVPFLRRVSIRNYKSIETADVSLRALTVLVGRNGSGKSNFLDALHFVADSLQTSLDHAFTSRGGFKEVRRRLVPTRLDDLNISIDLEVALPGGHRAKYGFVIGFDHEVGLRVQRETLQVNSLAGPVAYYGVHGYGVHGGLVEWSLGIIPPPHLGDRLYLVNVSGFAEFRPCYEALSSMTFYNLNPDSMKKPQALDTGDLLRRDGSNLANIVGRLGKEQPDTFAGISGSRPPRQGLDQEADSGNQVQRDRRPAEHDQGDGPLPVQVEIPLLRQALP